MTEKKHLCCHSCGEINLIPNIIHEGTLRCYRCNTVMTKNTHCTLPISSAFALTSLILFYPAYSAPLLKISLHQFNNNSTVIRTILNLFVERHPFLGTVVGLTIFILPILYLLIVTYIPFIKSNNYFNRSILKILSYIYDWHMVDVFLMGILVSLVKLVKDFDLSVGLGFYFVIALTLTTALTDHYFDISKAWGKLK
jgi:paraquat-inducible protein A